MPTGIYKRTKEHRLAIQTAMKDRRWNYSGGYHAIHKWLKSNYGKAKQCENIDCLNRSRVYEWALLKGKQYKYNRDNFMQLCKSCHIKYDFTEKGRESIRKFNTGKKQSKSHIAKRVKKLIGKKRSAEFKERMRRISFIREAKKRKQNENN